MLRRQKRDRKARFSGYGKRSENQDTYKSAGVVVADCLGIPEGLQEWVGLKDDVLDVLLQQTRRGLGKQ